MRALAAEDNFEHGPLLHDVLSRQDEVHRGIQLSALELRQKAERPVIDGNDGNAVERSRLARTEHRAIPAEDEKAVHPLDLLRRRKEHRLPAAAGKAFGNGREGTFAHAVPIV